jgi:SAM-dependent methyltransferase
MSQGKIVLDVGSGIGEGMQVLRDAGAKEVFGFEVDKRLEGMYSNLMIDVNGSLKAYPTNAVDVITCVDVIEHCVYDLEMMNEMKRIAKEVIYVTTPNYTRSMCGNVTHAREYTIAQFMNFFEPIEIYSASPDGKVHRTKLLHRIPSGSDKTVPKLDCDIILDYSPQGPMNEKSFPNIDRFIVYDREVPITKRFNQTVDGMEWGHICGVFYD